MPGVCVGQCGQAQCSTEGVGLAPGHRWSPGAAGYAAAFHVWTLRRGCPPPVPHPWAGPQRGHPPQRHRELANAQTVNEHEHQDDEDEA